MTGKLFLLIEENCEDATFLTQAFAASPACTVHAVPTIPDASQYLQAVAPHADRSHLPPPVCIILTLKLGGHSPFDFFRWLRAKPAHDSTLVVMLAPPAYPAQLKSTAALLPNTLVLERPDNLAGVKRLITSLSRNLPSESPTLLDPHQAA